MGVNGERIYWLDITYGEKDLKDCLDDLIAIKNAEHLEKNMEDTEELEEQQG